MKLHLTLSRYIGWQFLVAIAFAYLGMVGIVTMVDFVELLRRSSDKAHVPIGVLIQMILLKAPYLGIRLVPFAVLIGSMAALMRLTKSNELVVARAAGVSVWQFLMSPLALVLTIGIIFVTVFNPISAAMLSKYEQLEGRYFTGRPSLLAVSSSGLWLRQLENNNALIREYIIHAERVSQKDMQLSNVIVFIFGEKSHFLGRFDAASAKLEKGYWDLRNVTYSRIGQPPEIVDKYALTTDLTISQIQDSFASPMTLSFWQIPSFISILEKAGFSAIRHKVYWHSMLASPLLLCAMVLIAATFSLRLPRRGGIATLIAIGILTGFIVHFMSDLVLALGQSGSLPVILAAWSPGIVGIMAGVGLLLHYEDG